jgi:hypothetical protein
VSGKKTSLRLVNKLRAYGILPQNQPVQLLRIQLGGRKPHGNEWVWYARNPVNRVDYRVGSPHGMEELLQAAELRTVQGSQGITVRIAELRPGKPRDRQEKFMRYSCEPGGCGALPGEYCRVKGRPTDDVIHMARIRKYHQDNK